MHTRQVALNIKLNNKLKSEIKKKSAGTLPPPSPSRAAQQQVV
jgi:hypothetical protein